MVHLYRIAAHKISANVNVQSVYGALVHHYTIPIYHTHHIIDYHISYHTHCLSSMPTIPYELCISICINEPMNEWIGGDVPCAHCPTGGRCTQWNTYVPGNTPHTHSHSYLSETSVWLYYITYITRMSYKCQWCDVILNVCIGVMPGYWRAVGSTEFFQCNPPESCLGDLGSNDTASSIAQCAPGYQGKHTIIPSHHYTYIIPWDIYIAHTFVVYILYWLMVHEWSVTNQSPNVCPI